MITALIISLSIACGSILGLIAGLYIASQDLDYYKRLEKDGCKKLTKYRDKLRRIKEIIEGEDDGNED